MGALNLQTIECGERNLSPIAEDISRRNLMMQTPSTKVVCSGLQPLVLLDRQVARASTVRSSCLIWNAEATGCKSSRQCHPEGARVPVSACKYRPTVPQYPLLGTAAVVGRTHKMATICPHVSTKPSLPENVPETETSWGAA